MNFSQYQDEATKTAHFEGKSDEYKLMYVCLGLAGETGEAIEKVKKVMRNEGGELNDESRAGIKAELGDVLWYLSQIARLAGIQLEDVAQTNLKKLADRANRGVIKGEGDTR